MHILKIIFLFNGEVYHSRDYDKTSQYCNHVVEYLNDKNETNVGRIRNFLGINNKTFCIIEKLTKKMIEITGLLNLKAEIERYFVIVEKTEETDIVSIDKLIRKCIEITIDSEVYLTYCVDIEEHD